MRKIGWVLTGIAAVLLGLAGGWPSFTGQGDVLPKNLVYAAKGTTSVAPALAVAAATPPRAIQVSVNGQAVIFDVPPQYLNDRAYVPFRKLLEALGANVIWDNDKQIATAGKDGLKVTIPVGSKAIQMENHALSMDVPVVMIEDRTLVPLRYVAQALGAKVDWTQGESLDQIQITQTYERMIDSLVNGKQRPGDMKVTYEQAAILFEWLYKGQEKGQLPKFTGNMPIGDSPITERWDEYIAYWDRVAPNGGVYARTLRDIYTMQYRFSESGMFNESTDIMISSYISMADQTQFTSDTSRGVYIDGYYPER